MITNYDVVAKIIGEICPLGSTEEDDIRFENLKEYLILATAMVQNIKLLTVCSNHQAYSVARAGKLAEEWIKRLEKEIGKGE